MEFFLLESRQYQCHLLPSTAAGVQKQHRIMLSEEPHGYIKAVQRALCIVVYDTVPALLHLYFVGIIGCERGEKKEEFFCESRFSTIWILHAGAECYNVP